jgi:hypothetical protein
MSETYAAQQDASICNRLPPNFESFQADTYPPELNLKPLITVLSLASHRFLVIKNSFSLSIDSTPTAARPETHAMSHYKITPLGEPHPSSVPFPYILHQPQSGEQPDTEHREVRRHIRQLSIGVLVLRQALQ